MMGMSKEVGELAAANIGRVALDNVECAGRKRADDLVKNVADLDFDDRLLKFVKSLGKEVNMFVFFGGMTAKLRREVLAGSEFTLKVVADALGIALAAAVQVEHPTVCDRVGNNVAVKAAL